AGHVPPASTPDKMRHANCPVVVERGEPEIDRGRYPIKRVVGERVVVEADVFTGGHDELACVLRYRAADDLNWRETPMRPTVNDRWRGGVRGGRLRGPLFTPGGWVGRGYTPARRPGRGPEAGPRTPRPPPHP